MKSFIETQFAYYPLVWMCCNKTSDNHINHLHGRALRTVYNDNVSTFEKILEKDNSVTIQVRNLRILSTEKQKKIVKQKKMLYKTKENLTAPILHEVLKTEEYPI